MNVKYNGGPAFPSGLQEQADDTVDSLHKGMTLRDYMAIHASDEDVLMQSHAIREKSSTGILPDNWVVTARYMHADCMLQARKF
ncbi:hypothetical protein UFOVP37_82 [uncultured Caudovirales phage]|uniref:Uncharacterized protein n=1 Tax=uncultured Caudovirales phage TaxID=2100421 RepID=A0A6J5KS96_9CAUD|nr:hypothetical protein UFOVP37_82 [uncultured Caudovirales phage]